MSRHWVYKEAAAYVQTTLEWPWCVRVLNAPVLDPVHAVSQTDAVRVGVQIGHRGGLGVAKAQNRFSDFDEKSVASPESNSIWVWACWGTLRGVFRIIIFGVWEFGARCSDPVDISTNQLVFWMSTCQLWLKFHVAIATVWGHFMTASLQPRFFWLFFNNCFVKPFVGYLTRQKYKRPYILLKRTTFFEKIDFVACLYLSKTHGQVARI